MNKMIGLMPRIYLTTRLSAATIDDVLFMIKTGRCINQDLQGITGRLYSLQDHNQLNEEKKQNLPVALFNGTFRYKSADCLSEYSSFTAIDFDNFISEEKLCEIGQRLVVTPCVYAVYRTPSGRGLKAVILHDNTNPEYHGELYSRLLEKFEVAGIDSSCADLARGNYICYDPNLWMNPNCAAYHFEHDPEYQTPVKAKTGGVQNVKTDINELREMLSGRPLQGVKSDESIIAILNSRWTKEPGRWSMGNRANSVFNSASQLCNAGVSMDNALGYLVEAYLKTGLEENEILYQALRGYQCNAEGYGSTRKWFDGYGKRGKR